MRYDRDHVFERYAMKAALLLPALFAGLLAASPAAAIDPSRIAPENSRTVGDCSRSSDDCYRGKRSFRRSDCHRNIRTHRIGGALIRHRHVGDDCAVREVRKADSAGRP
jgi:hypothetical protein